MAIIYQNPLKKVAKPQQITDQIEIARNPKAGYAERRNAISYLRGVYSFYRREPKHKAVTVYLKQVIAECQKRLNVEE